MKTPRVYVSNGRYYYVQDLERRHPVTGRPLQKWHALTRVAAGEAALHQALADLLAEHPVGRGNMPQALATFKSAHLPTLTPAVRKEYERMFAVIADAFADFNIDQVKPGVVRKFLNDNFADKPTARRAYKARLSTFFSWAVVEDLTPVNPCRELKLKAPPRRKTKWTDALFWAMRDQLAPMHQCYHDLSVLLYQRTTDVRYLLRSRVADGVIRFEPTKTARSSGAGVDIPVTPEIQSVLDRALAIQREWGVVCAYVISTRQGTPYTATGISSAYERADAKLHTPAGQKEPVRLGLNPKSLLPYAVTRAKRVLGYSLEQIKDGRAHTTITTTEGYVQAHDTPLSQVRMTLPERKA